MDVNDFRDFGKAAIEFIADYLENIRDRDVLPSVEPGYLINTLPKTMAEKPDHWKNVMDDMNKVIMPGLTHWQSPNFYAYFPSGNSYPSIVGELLTAGIGVLGFNWMCSPAATELEVVVMDWLVELLELPKHFLHSDDGPGGGVLQGSASEAILIAVIAARELAMERLRTEYPNEDQYKLRSKLIAYTSDQSNSAVEKSGILADVPMKLLRSNDAGELCGDTLRKTIKEDIESGLYPIICIATLGTTGTCSFDKLNELGPICTENKIWLHVDGAYAGAALCCPEYRSTMLCGTPEDNGLQWMDSFNFNLHKCMMVNYDCCAMWLKNTNHLIDAFNVDRIYLKHQYEALCKIPEFRHWQISLGRKFRSMKTWIVLRTLGAENIRENVRNRVRLADRFEAYLRADSRFHVSIPNSLGLVCFKLNGNNSEESTKKLLDALTENKKIFLISASHQNQVIIRFVVSGQNPIESDIDYAWNEIKLQTDLLYSKENYCLNYKQVNVDDLNMDKVIITGKTNNDIVDKIFNKHTNAHLLNTSTRTNTSARTVFID